MLKDDTIPFLLKVYGVPTAPHMVRVDSKSVSFISISWASPAVAGPEDFIKYR